MTENFGFRNSSSYGSNNCKGIGFGNLDNYYSLNQFIGFGDGTGEGFGEANLTGEGAGLSTSSGDEDSTGLGFGNQFPPNIDHLNGFGFGNQLPLNVKKTNPSFYSFSLCGTYDLL